MISHLATFETLHAVISNGQLQCQQDYLDIGETVTINVALLTLCQANIYLHTLDETLRHSQLQQMIE